MKWWNLPSQGVILGVYVYIYISKFGDIYIYIYLQIWVYICISPNLGIYIVQGINMLDALGRRV